MDLGRPPRRVVAAVTSWKPTVTVAAAADSQLPDSVSEREVEVLPCGCPVMLWIVARLVATATEADANRSS